nr:hypothetical protein [Azospirillum baldaniorum]
MSTLSAAIVIGAADPVAKKAAWLSMRVEKLTPTPSMDRRPAVTAIGPAPPGAEGDAADARSPAQRHVCGLEADGRTQAAPRRDADESAASDVQGPAPDVEAALGVGAAGVVRRDGRVLDRQGVPANQDAAAAVAAGGDGRAVVQPDLPLPDGVHSAVGEAHLPGPGQGRHGHAPARRLDATRRPAAHLDVAADQGQGLARLHGHPCAIDLQRPRGPVEETEGGRRGGGEAAPARVQSGEARAVGEAHLVRRADVQAGRYVHHGVGAEGHAGRVDEVDIGLPDRGAQRAVDRRRAAAGDPADHVAHVARPGEGHRLTLVDVEAVEAMEQIPTGLGAEAGADLHNLAR